MSAAGVLLGTAGWALPRAHAHAFPEGGAHLERYARVFDAAEINSTFHRPHRATTYERWARSVPASFRFCLKVPKTITHGARLADTEALLDAFFSEIAPLASKVACILVQLPPSLEFDPATASRFFTALRERHPAAVACEPRHASWLSDEADRLLVAFRVARVAADPNLPAGAAAPGGWDGLRYFRWHGSPRRYYSSYTPDALAGLTQRLRDDGLQSREVWCIFDNTVAGAAIENALAVRQFLSV